MEFTDMDGGPYRLGRNLLEDRNLSGGAFGSLYEATDRVNGASVVAKIPRVRGGGRSGTEVWGPSAAGGQIPIHVPAVVCYEPTGGGVMNIDLLGPDIEHILVAEADLLERDEGQLLPLSHGLWEIYRDGRAIPVLVMERLEGREGASSIDDVVAVLAALAAAVERGTLDFHGDLKMEHVFFAADGRVRLCDPAPRLDDLRAFTPLYNPRGRHGPAADAAACATMLRHIVPNGQAAWQWCAQLLEDPHPPAWAASHASALDALRDTLDKRTFPPPGWTPPPLPNRFGEPNDLPATNDLSPATTVPHLGDIDTLDGIPDETDRVTRVRMQPMIPHGWFVKQSVTLLHPSGQANMIASTEPLAVDVGTDQYADTQGELLRTEFPGYNELEGGWVVLPSGHRARWRRFTWTPPDGVPVTQLQIYVAGNGEGHTATGTSPSTVWHHHSETMHALMRTMQIDASAATAATTASPSDRRPMPPLPPGSPSRDVAGDERVRVSNTPLVNEPVGPPPTEFERPQVTLGDVAGLDAVKQHIDVRLLAPLRNPELAKRFGKTPSGGLLMWGPPGCGKTFVARAIAGSLDIDFCAIGIDEVLDMWIGSSERNLSGVFAAARSHAPAALFFDEVDALGGRRSRMGVDVTARSLVSVLLTELDGAVRDNSGVFTIGATNLPWDVDPALRRPGRFDRTLFVPPPDLDARNAILAQKLSSVPIGDDLDLPRIAPKLHGLSGADVAAVVDRAVDDAFTRSVASGSEVVVDQTVLERAASTATSSIADWVETATTAAEASNDTALYDPFLHWLNRRDHEK